MGEVIASVGGIESPPDPLPVTPAETVPPPAAIMRFVLTVDAIVGVNRTLTAWLAPTPARANGVPDTTLNGAATDAVPDTVPPAVFVRVTVCSAKLPRLTLPKFSGPVGLKANSARATALTSVEQALSRPEASTALTAAR